MEPAKQHQTEAREEIDPIDPIDVIVAEIRSDATHDPKTYLRETIVPEGGE